MAETEKQKNERSCCSNHFKLNMIMCILSDITGVQDVSLNLNRESVSEHRMLLGRLFQSLGVKYNLLCWTLLVLRPSVIEDWLGC